MEVKMRFSSLISFLLIQQITSLASNTSPSLPAFPVLISSKISFTSRAKENVTGKTISSTLSTVKRGQDNVPRCMESNAEIGLVIDSSSSIHPNDFRKGIAFMTSFLSLFDIGPTYKQVRVAAVTYGYGVYDSDSFSLNTFGTKEEVLEAVRQMPFRAGLRTDTGDAIQFMLQRLMAKARDWPTRKFIIVLTDGNSQRRTYTADVARSARNMGFSVFAVGVGSVSYDELINIAGNKARTVTSDTYDNLMENVSYLADNVCKRMSLTYELHVSYVLTICDDGMKMPKEFICDLDKQCRDQSDESYCGPPHILKEESGLKSTHFARVNETFSVHFQVKSFYNSSLLRVSLVGANGIVPHLLRDRDWTQQIRPDVMQCTLSTISLIITNVTSSIVDSWVILTVSNEMGTDSASFLLGEKGKPRERNGNVLVRDAFTNSKMRTMIIAFQFECHPVPRISGIEIQDDIGSQVLPSSKWSQAISENNPRLLITTITLNIQYTSDDFFKYRYIVNVTNSEGMTTLDFRVSAQEITQSEDTLMIALITASSVTLIVITVGAVMCWKKGRSIYSKIKKNQPIEMSHYLGLDANGRRITSSELEEVYDEIVDESSVDPEVGKESLNTENACMLIPSQDGMQSPVPACCFPDDPHSGRQNESSNIINIDVYRSTAITSGLTATQHEQTDKLSSETASVGSEDSQYLYPVYTATIASNAPSISVPQDSDYEIPNYSQRIFVFSTASRPELPTRTANLDIDQQTVSARLQNKCMSSRHAT